ncbi:TolB family protein [Candidatus Palauibacter sp.]|uniref:TolB family protein n=1 Tax=Candidatus Palauibacter sp. TaxID=3101350 RepID=UPI003B023414
MRSLPVALVLPAAVLALPPQAPLAAQERPLTFMDVQEMKRAGSWTPSPNGAWMLYTVTTPDWEEAESQTDIHLVALDEGVSSSRQLTYTEDKNETSPTWGPDGSFFLFSSNRDGDENQLYMMRHDGGEARKITDAEEGVSGFAFSPDGRWLVYRSGESNQEQLYRLPADDLAGAEPEQLTDGEAGVDQWDFSPDGSRVYFARPDAFDEDEKKRREEGFTVDVRNAITPLSNLWSVEVESAAERAPDRRSVLQHQQLYDLR